MAAWSMRNLVLSASLTASLSNMAVATLRRPEIHQQALAFFAFLSVNLVFATLALIFLGLLTSKLAGPLGLDRGALGFASAVGVVVVATCLPLFTLVHPTGLAGNLAVYAMILSNALLAPLLAYQIAIRASLQARKLAAGLLVALPIIAILALALLWLQLYRIEGLTSPESLLWTTAFGVAMIVTLVATLLLRDSLRVFPMLTAPVILVIAAPLVPAFVTRSETTTALHALERDQPSVLLLTVDTLRADALELGPGDRTRTPSLARLADKSIVFEEARAAAPWTKPSVASMLTGLSPLVHRTTKTDSRLPDEIQTLAEYLEARGYRTAAIGRNSFFRDSANLGQGFEDYHFFPSSSGGSFGGQLLGRLAPIHFGWSDPSSRDLTEIALNWLRENHDRPFFLWLHYFDPHIPYAPPADAIASRQSTGRIGRSFDNLRGIRGGQFVPNKPERSSIRELYEAEVRDVDFHAGRVLDLMREMDLFDRALIVFTSDHGEEFWEHGGFEHGHALYDEVLRVPLLIKVPGNLSVARITERVSTESLTATILDVLGLMEGTGPFTAGSLAGHWKGETKSAASSNAQLMTGVLYYEEKVSVIFDGFKYIRGEQTGREELFDLEADPEERRSVAAKFPDRLQQARILIDRLNEESVAIRSSLDLPEESMLEPDEDWMERLRALSYVE